jgi:hypothetical protein
MPAETTTDEPPSWRFLGLTDPIFWRASHIAHSI